MASISFRRITSAPIALTLLFGTNPTTIDSSNIAQNGYLQSIWLTLPTLDAAATATINVKDPNGNIVFTKNALAGNQTVQVVPTAQVPVYGNMIYEIVTSANQTSNKAITVLPIVDQLN